MFTITGDTLAGIVVGFALGVLAHYIYIRYAYELTEDEKPTEKPEVPAGAGEPKGEPKTFGRSCQKFTAAVNQHDICQYLFPSSGNCSLFKRQVFVLGSKYERCAECKAKYPEKQQGR